MGSLYSALNISVGSLEAQQAGLETTTNNLANMNTPGYSRQRPVLQEADPIVQGGLAFGNGVTLTGIESLRDSLLNVQINNETQEQSKSQAFVNTMNQVQPLFPMDTSGIGAAISTFFQSLNGLSANPSDSSLRQSVLSAANGLASSFSQAAGQLNSTRSNLDLSVQQDVQQVNQITSQIASINRTLATTSSTGSSYGSFLDQRDALVQQLSGLIDVSVLQNGSSLTLTTRQGTALVVDGQNFNLTTRLDSNDGTQHIYAQAGDITSAISGGSLGGALEARDQSIPSMLGQLDTLASALVTNLNAANKMGYDLNGDPGGNLFNPVTGVGSAAAMSVAITNPNLLAASSDGSTGSNGNIANLTAVATQAVSNGMTPIETYGNLVFQVGSSISNANAELTASNNVLQQLQQQQQSVSGVSLDEEASNLLLYERAYQAAARAISTVDQMLQTAINMGTGT
jgi:flagellar hook-associated protein 1